MSHGELYFCCTSGGAAKLGRIMRYRPAPDEGRRAEGGMVQIVVESTSKPMLDFGDNLTVAPNGHLVMCEDQYNDTVANRLIGVTPAGQTYVLGLLRAQTELAGVLLARRPDPLRQLLQPGANLGDHHADGRRRLAAFLDQPARPEKER